MSLPVPDGATVLLPHERTILANKISNLKELEDKSRQASSELEEIVRIIACRDGKPFVGTYKISADLAWIGEV